MPEGIDLDTTCWPVVVLRPPESVEDAAFIEFLERWEFEVLGRGEPFVMVIVAEGTRGITPTQRKILSKRDEHAMLRGTALVFSSGFLRGMLTALFWLRKRPHPIEVFPTLEEARAWAVELISAQLHRNAG